MQPLGTSSDSILKLLLFPSFCTSSSKVPFASLFYMMFYFIHVYKSHGARRDNPWQAEMSYHFDHWLYVSKNSSVLWFYPHFYAPPPESGGVLCYTLRNFECPSVCLSVSPSVRPSVSAHHHSCIGNSSYSFRPILLKLYRCFKDGLKICILFFQNPEIIFYHFFPIFNLDIFRALILQICIWSMYLVSATPPTVFGESFWNFTGVLRMVWRYAYCFFRILKLFFITFFAFLT